MMRRRWDKKSIISLFDSVEMYMSSGLSLHQALRALAPSFPRKRRFAIERIIEQIERGKPLSVAISEHIGISPVLESLIRQGESSGQLMKSISFARSVLERSESLFRSCISALAYPAIIGSFAGILVIGLMRGVMPQIIPMLKSLRVPLPFLTRAVMYASDHLFDQGSMLFGTIIALAGASFFLYRRSASFRFISQRIASMLPVVGRLVDAYVLSLTMRSLGSLISSGANVVHSYDHVSRKIAFLPLKRYFEDRYAHVRQGKPFALVFSSMNKRLPYLCSIVSAGEASGQLGSSLMKAADMIDKDIEHSLKRVTALIEPIMMICVGIVVGCIALSIMMPIYEISKSLQH